MKRRKYLTGLWVAVLTMSLNGMAVNRGKVAAEDSVWKEICIFQRRGCLGNGTSGGR